MANSSTNGGSTRKARKPFELIAGNAALDLVNTLDWRFREEPPPEELLRDYDDLAYFSAQSGLISDALARRLIRNVSESKAAHVVVAVRELREAAALVLYAALDGDEVPGSAVASLERNFKRARDSQRLQKVAGKLDWEFSQGNSLPELPLWLLSLRAAELVTSDEMERVRACGNAECRWLFLDTSKNHTRRWCDMKICGNRMKARRFKAQHRG
ncbi:MAG: CGNR zinc finger domain-containing protein [Terracidiphilus sp.]